MSDDIIKQLETMWLAKEPKLLWGDMQAITDLAAFEIERLRAENEKLRAALAEIGYDFSLNRDEAAIEARKALR